MPDNLTPCRSYLYFRLSLSVSTSIDSDWFRVRFLWQSCNLINDSCNAISIACDSPQFTREKRERERETMRERGSMCIVLCSAVVFNLSEYKPETVARSLQFIFHLPEHLSIEANRRRKGKPLIWFSQLHSLFIYFEKLSVINYNFELQQQ